MKKERLEEFNDWWFTSRVPKDLLEKYKRDLFGEIVRRLGKRQVVAITGLRRVGKTTLMYQLIQHLLDRGVEPTNVLYFSFDERARELNDVLDTYRLTQGKDLRKNRVYVFLDEVQKLENWQNQLKKYHDLYPKVCFVISGSESLFIRKRTRETLAGRMVEFFLPTLSFKEFLGMKGIDAGRTSELKMKTVFTEYVMKGGFPEVVHEKDYREVQRYVKSSVIDKILFKDILTLSGLRDPGLLSVVLEIIAVNPGMQLEYQSLAQQLDRSRHTIKEYVTWLREGFLVNLLGNYRKGRTASLRKSKKAYMADTGVIAVFKPAIDEAFFGRMVESLVINSMNAKFFWKNRHDVDAVIDGTPVEVKYREKVLNSDLKGIKEFMRKFNVKKGLVVSKNEEKCLSVGEGEITLTPAWKFLLNPKIKK